MSARNGPTLSDRMAKENITTTKAVAPSTKTKRLGNIFSVCERWQKPGIIKMYWSNGCTALKEENKVVRPRSGEEVSNQKGAQIEDKELQTALGEVDLSAIKHEDTIKFDVELSRVKVKVQDQIIPGCEIQSTTDEVVELENSCHEFIFEAKELEEAQVAVELEESMALGVDLKSQMEVQETYPELMAFQIESSASEVGEQTRNCLQIDQKKPADQVDLEDFKATVKLVEEKSDGVNLDSSLIKQNKIVSGIEIQPLPMEEGKDEANTIHATKRSGGPRLKYFPPLEFYECDVCCSLKFKTENERIQHLMKLAQRSSWKCVICEESFGRPTELNRHMMVLHQRPTRTTRSRPSRFNDPY